MTKPDLTAIGLVVDRSGSMSDIRDEAQRALDDFVAAQHAQPGEVCWTVTFFSGQVDNRGVNTPKPDNLVIHPGGITALNDAIGDTVTRMGDAFSAMPEDERPSKVLVAILTDGLENASREYTSEQVRALVKRQADEWQWEFVFLATGMDQFTATRQAAKVGVAEGQTLAVSRADHYAGTQTVNSYVSSYRRGGSGTLRDHADKEQ